MGKEEDKYCPFKAEFRICQKWKCMAYFKEDDVCLCKLLDFGNIILYSFENLRNSIDNLVTTKK